MEMTILCVAIIVFILFGNVRSKPLGRSCDPELFSNFMEEEVSTCSMLYQKFEEALIVPFNIYKLRQVMFPNERAEPLVVDINYTLIVHTLDDDPCHGADHESLINTTALDTEGFVKTVVWTSSVTLSIIDPKDLDFLQPGILTLTNPVARHSYYDSNLNPNQVSLVLAVGTLNCTPSENQVINVLEDLTTKVKGYAANTDQDGRLDSWDTAYKGYIAGTNDLEFLFVIGPALSLVVIFLMCAFPVAYKKGYRDKLKDKLRNHDNPYFPLFISVTVIVVVIDAIYYLSELACLIAILNFLADLQLLSSVSYYKPIIVRVFLQLLSLIFCLVTVYTILVWKKMLSDKPSGQSGNDHEVNLSRNQGNHDDHQGLCCCSRNFNNVICKLIRPCCCNPSKFTRNKDYSICCFCNKCDSEHYMLIRVEDGTEESDIKQYFKKASDSLCCSCCFLKCGSINLSKDWLGLGILFTYGAFLCMIAWSVVPILTLVFVNPVLTLAIVSFVIVFFILSSFLISLLFFVRGQKKWKQTFEYYREKVNPLIKLEVPARESQTGSTSGPSQGQSDPTNNAQQDDQAVMLNFNNPVYVANNSSSNTTSQRLSSHAELREQNQSSCKVYCSMCLAYTICWDFFYIFMAAIILFVFGTAVVLVIYIMIVNKGAGDGGTVGFVVAFIPTLITGIGAWIGKKALFKSAKTDSLSIESDGTANTDDNNNARIESV